MNDTLIATARWRALDPEGQDICHLNWASDGWHLSGQARFRDATGLAEIDYSVECDDAWETQNAHVYGQHGDRAIDVKITRDGDNWYLNNVVCTDVSGSKDIDLSFTPATNLMPLRRLMSTNDAQIHSSAAWFRYPEEALVPLDQTYAKTDAPDIISYSAKQSGFATQLTIDPSGFVVRYPDAWEGEVTHAA